MKTGILLLFLSGFLFSQSMVFTGKPELVAPDTISTDKTEVKLTFSPDGKLLLWGAIRWENGMGGFDIWQADKNNGRMGNLRPVAFNSDSNDFDPCFSPDGKTVYFFSNRSGGFGGDDFYSVTFNPVSGKFGEPENMGEKFNSKGDEWGPVVSADGKKFIFCSDGFGGKGKHDIFLSEKVNKSWSDPVNVEAINSDKDDFDPVILHDNKTIIFSKEINDNEVLLFVSFLSDTGYTKPVQLGPEINNPGTWNFGSTIDNSDYRYLYYCSHNPANTKGRIDIYRIAYKIDKSGL